MAATVSREQAFELYNLFSSGQSVDEISEKLYKSNSGKAQVNKNEISQQATILTKIAKAVKSKEEFYECITSDSLPAVKLTRNEMEMLKGGATPFYAGMAILYGGMLLYDLVKGK